MAAPVIQFKKGQFANLPGLRKGEPGFTTDFYDLYIGINSTTDGNKFFGSHRYWKRETTTSGSGIRLVEGTNNGSGDITIQAPGSISGLTTYTMPTSGVLNQFLKIESIESTDDGNFDCTLGFGTVSVDTNIVEDPTPQLGGNLDLNNKDITGTGGINISGVGTFTSLDPVSITIKNGRFLYLGNSNEGSITYDAANLEIVTSSGDLNLKGSGSVALFEGSNKKLETTTTGVIVTGIATATTFSGSGASLTSIPNSALDNSTVSYGGVQLSLGGSDATPAFDLSDATNYPFTSLTGIATDIVGDASPQLGGDLDLNSNDITGTGNFNITGIITATNYRGVKDDQFIAGFDAGGLNETTVSAANTQGGRLIAIGTSAARTFGTNFASQAVNSDTGIIVIGNNSLDESRVTLKRSATSYGQFGESMIHTTVIGNDAYQRCKETNRDIVIGQGCGAGVTHSNYNVFLGSNLGLLPNPFDGNQNFQSENVVLGHMACLYLGNMNKNVVMGARAGSIRDGNNNVYLGAESGEDARYSNGSIGIGYSSLSLSRDSIRNIGIGSESGITLSGSDNICIGRRSGYGLTAVSNNLILVSGSSDTPANVAIADGDNQLVIGAGATAWVYGDRSYNIGIGITAPTQKLDVDGTVKATSLVKSGGTSSQFLKADGSVDSSTYITSADGGNASTLDGIDSTSFLRSDAADSKTSGNLTFSDNIQARFGSSGDLQIYHDGTDNHIKSDYDKDLNIEISPDGSNPKIYIRPTTSHQGITLGGGSGNPVELYHTNAKKLETTASGVSVTGGTLVSAASTFSGNLNIGGNAIVTGDLTVNGTTTQLNTTSTTVEDVLLELQVVDGSAPSSDTNKDVGIVMNYFLDSAKKAALYWDDSVGRIVAADDVSESNGVLTASTFAAFEIGSLYLNDCAGSSQVISCSGTTRSLENITIDAGTF